MHVQHALSMFFLALMLLGLTPQEPQAQSMDWDDFPVFVWRQDREKQALDERFRRAFGATNLGRGEDSSALGRERIAFYVDNAAGRNDLHLDRDKAYEERAERWYRTRDESLLVRQPCLNDPSVIERLRATLELTLKQHALNSGLGLSLGDEVSFTPYGSPEDTCLCLHCKSAWREWLTAQEGDEKLRLAPDFELARASTDAARLALESAEPEPIQAWLLRRAFTQAMMQKRLRELAQQARRARPDVKLGLLGMVGRTAFGGVAIDGLLPQLGFAESYRVSDARELLFTLRGAGQRVVQTIFFDEDCAAAAPWFAWESWMRGADGLVIWSDRELKQHAEYADLLERSVQQIRGVNKRAPDFAPIPRGVAIVNDEDSIAFGWLVDAALDGPTWPRRLQGWQEEHGSREKSLRAWLRLFEDCGAMPGALPLSQVAAGTVARFPVLVLNHLRVLDDSGMARLRAFLAAEGTLLVRGELGRIDARGRSPSKARLELLREAYPKSIVEIGAELDAYLGERLGGGVALRERLTRVLAAHEDTLAPWRMQSEGAPLPWLMTWSEASNESTLCAALPNLVEGGEREGLVESPGRPARQRLRALRVKVQCAPGFELEWLQPHEATGRSCELEAGEAAVFRLVKVEKK